MPQFDIALVAYTPDGARLGPLPAPLAITSAANPLNDMPVLAFDYLKDAPGAQHLANPIEVAVEVYNPATGTWIEPKNSRYLLLDWDQNQMEVTGKASYACPGYATLLDKITTRPPSAADRSQEITTAKALAAAAKTAYAAATAALKTAVGVPAKSGVVFADYEPTVTNNAVWVDSDESPIKVYKGSRPKGQTGTWVAVSTTAARTAATTAYTKKLEYDDANAGVTRAQNDKTFDREFPQANAGKIMHTLMTEAQARGDRIPGMTWDFTATTDSNGQPWAMTFEEPLVIRAGQSALDVLTDLTGQGLCDWVMEGRVLHLYNADTALLRDKTSYQLLPGLDIKDAPDRGTYNSLTHNVLFLGEEGLTFELTNNVPITPWGKWEKSVSQGGVTRRSTGQLLGQAELDAGAGPRTESTRDLIFNDTRPLPYIHYVVGDTVSTFGADGTAETMRVRQITLSRDAKGVPGGNLVLGDRFLEREVRQSRLIDGVMGGTVPKGNGSLPGTPVIPTERRPEAPHDLIAVANNYSDPNGKQIGRLLIDWVWDGTDTNGTPIEGNGFQVQIRPDHVGEPWASARTVPESTMTLDDVRIRTEAGAIEIYNLRVRAVAYNGRTSDWSETFTVMMAADVTPPPVPSKLQGIPDHGAITAFWDGLGAGGEKMPLDFRATEGEIASAPGGPWTLFASYPYKGNMQVPQQLAYGTYWLRARSVDTSGNYSAYSELSTVTTTPLVDLPDVHDLIADYNQKFAEAMEGVGIAQASANGKNNNRFSTSAPTITGGEREGDVWWRYSNSTMTVLIGTWIFASGAWKPFTFGHQTFDSVDAGKISFGFMDGVRIKAKSLNIEHINVGDFSNLVTIDPGVPVNVTIPAAFATVAAGGFTYKADGGSDYLMFKDQNGPVPFKSGDWIRVAFDAMATSDVVIPTTVYFYPNKTGTTGSISASGTPITVTTAVQHYSFDIQVPNLDPIGGGKSWTIGLAGAGARQIGVKNVTAYRKVDATTIAPDSIRTPMLGADIIEGRHIKGNTIEGDNLKFGFADGKVITGSLIQTQSEVDKGLKFDLMGFRAYSQEGGTPVFEVRPDGGTVVTITQPVTGDALASINEHGDGSFQGLNVAEDPVINGTYLLGDLLDYESPTTYEPTGILDQLPRGIVARGVRNMQAVTVSRRERAILELQFYRAPGRSYRVTVNPVAIYAQPGVRASIFMRTAWGGERPTLDTGLTDRIAARPSGGGTGSDEMVTLGGSFMLQGGTDALTRLLFSVSSMEGDSTFFDTATGGNFEVWVEDMGMSVAETGIDRNDINYAEPTTPPVKPTPPPTRKNYTKYYSPTDFRSYLQSGSVYIRDGKEVTKMFQGNSPWPPGGALRSIATFPSFTGDLSGATITSVRIKVRFDHWWYNSGGIADITIHGQSSIPSTRPSVTTVSGISSKYTNNWPKPGTRWVPIPSAYWGGIKDGTWKGFGLGDGASGLTHYGYGMITQVEIKFSK